MLSLSGDPRREPFEPGLPGVVRMADPYCFRCPFDKEPATCAHECAQDLETVLLREGADTVAAVIIEGVVGADGVLHRARRLLEEIHAIYDRHGVLLIAGEALSGFGRPGRSFAVDHDGVTADLLTMAKGITAGYARRHRHRHRPGRPALRRAGARVPPDQLRPPAGLQAIVAAIKLSRRGAGPRAATAGARLRGVFDRIARQRPYLGEMRGVGVLWASSFVYRARTDPFPRLPWLRSPRQFADHLHMHKRDNLVYFAPPLVITDAQLDKAIAPWSPHSTRDYHDGNPRRVPKPSRAGLRRAKPGYADTIMSYTSPPIEKVFPRVESARSGLLHDGMTILSAASACRATPRPDRRRRRARRARPDARLEQRRQPRQGARLCCSPASSQR